jgi:hypothetical protein
MSLCVECGGDGFCEDDCMRYRPKPKAGELILPAFLAFVRTLPCRVARYPNSHGKCSGRTEAHHWPPKRMGGGWTRDDRTIPLCTKHHADVGRGAYTDAMQDGWAAETRARFLDEAPWESVVAYVVALKAWRERPLAVPW